MTINEFRAWLDGFKESVGNAPTPDQWAKVQEKLATVNISWGIPPSIPSASDPSFQLRNPTSATASCVYVNGQYAGPSD